MKPGLIIANKEENTESQILQLATKHNVWLTDINTLEDATTLITHLGILAKRAPEAQYLNHLLRQGFNDLIKLKTAKATHGFLYFIWKNRIY